MDFKSTIEVLPDLLSYFIPGAVSILIYNFLFLKKIEHTELLFWGIIISYLTKIISEAIVPEQFTSVAHILFCVFLPLIWFALNRVGVLSWFSKKTRLNDTENIWLRTIDFEKDNYIWLRFLYKGIIINHNKKPSQPTLKRRFFKKKAAFFHGPVWERSGADFILKRKGEFF